TPGSSSSATAAKRRTRASHARCGTTRRAASCATPTRATKRRSPALPSTTSTCRWCRNELLRRRSPPCGRLRAPGRPYGGLLRGGGGMELTIDGQRLTLGDLRQVWRQPVTVTLGGNARERVAAAN